MKRILLLFSFVIISGILSGTMAQCTSCTYTYSGSGGTNFNLATGEKLCITGDAGSLSINVNGNSSICVATGVTWNAAGSIAANQPLTIDVYGTLTATTNSSNANIIINVYSGATFNFGGTALGNGGVTINNSGTVNFTTTSQLTIQGNGGQAKTINNLSGGVVNATSPSLVLFQQGNGILVNSGTFNVTHLENAEGNITNNAGASVNISGNFYNHGDFKNYGAVVGTGTACGGSPCLFTVGDKGAGFGFKNYSTGTTSFVGNSTFQGYMVNEGAMSLTGNLTITWNGNNMAGGGSLVVNNGISTIQNSGACFAQQINFCDRNTVGHGFDNANGCTNYTTANCSTLLPVRIINFDFVNSAVDTRVRWTVETDEDNNRYELQSGTDGINLTLLETVVDNSKGLITYFSKPVNPATKTFYRLVIINKDGSRSYSNIIVLNSSNTDIINIFPNPVRNSTFTLSVKNPAATLLNVFTTEGRLLLTKKFNGQTSYQIELPSAVKGPLVAEVLHQGTYKRIKLQSL